MKRTIVIAEDNEIINRVLEYRLISDGYDVKVFLNGEDAVAFMRENQFDLLITDLYMPLMNGIDVIQAVRESISGSVPIMATSVTHDEDLIVRLFDMGVNDFVVKPFRAGELSVRVKRLIGEQ
jgi:DNA-binding response OmpR family regulator